MFSLISFDRLTVSLILQGSDDDLIRGLRLINEVVISQYASLLRSILVFNEKCRYSFL